MKLIRLALATLALTLGLAALNASAQSSQQPLAFSILMEYQYETNTVIDAGAETNNPSTLRTLLITPRDVLKAIGVDLFGKEWTNWMGGSLVRRVNLTNGTEGIYLRNGAKFTNVSSFFGTSFTNDFSEGAPAAFPGLTNSFSPQLPIFHGWVTNEGATNFTNIVSLSNVRFISLNTTNLKFNLIGVNLAALRNGRFTNVAGTTDGVHYSLPVDSLLVSAVGDVYINISTNLFTNAQIFVSGPARGTFGTGFPTYSHFAGPPGP